jgi:hypothetical protein
LEKGVASTRLGMAKMGKAAANTGFDVANFFNRVVSLILIVM